MGATDRRISDYCWKPIIDDAKSKCLITISSWRRLADVSRAYLDRSLLLLILLLIVQTHGNKQLNKPTHSHRDRL
eukprot:scaffold35137_cov70-Attheya_sp.AAC.2